MPPFGNLIPVEMQRATVRVNNVASWKSSHLKVIVKTNVSVRHKPDCKYGNSVKMQVNSEVSFPIYEVAVFGTVVCPAGSYRISEEECESCPDDEYSEAGPEQLPAQSVLLEQLLTRTGPSVRCARQELLRTLTGLIALSAREILLAQLEQHTVSSALLAP